MVEFNLREWKLDDAESLVRFGNNPNIARFMTNRFPSPYTLEKAQSFLEEATQQNASILRAIVLNGQAIGGIGIHPQTDIFKYNAELGYWLGEPFWRQGIVSRAIHQMVQLAFSRLDITRIYARVYGNNLASQKLIEQCGFKLEATILKSIYKNDEFLNELIYAIRRA